MSTHDDDGISTDPSDYSDLEAASQSPPPHNMNNIQIRHLTQSHIHYDQNAEISPNHQQSDTDHKTTNTDSMDDTDMNIDDKQPPTATTKTFLNRSELEQESLDFLLAKTMSLHPELQWNVDDEWCRYCGARASSSFLKSPWGPNKLCYKHHKIWKQKILDLSTIDEPRDIESVINKSECTEKEYLIDILMQYENTNPLEYRRRSLRNRNIKSVSVSNECSDHYHSSSESGSNDSGSWSGSDSVSSTGIKHEDIDTEMKARKRTSYIRVNKCKECGKICASTNEFILHSQESHSNKHMFPCRQCEKAYTTRGNLHVHIRKVHEKERNFCCELCDKWFLNKSEWINHRKRHNMNNMGDFADSTSTTYRKHPKYKCGQCEKRFKKQHYLKRHMINIHTANEDKPYQCRYCTYGSARKWSLDCHEAIHLNARQFKCDQCGKAFNVKHELARHLKSVHIKKHKCRECMKKFGSKTTLKYHMINAHTKNVNKPHQCRFCDYGAATPYIVKKHEMKHAVKTEY